MDLLSGSPFWPIKNGLLATYPPLTESAKCDVAVVGAGITGACVAHELTAAGIDTVVLDRRDVGTGSTSGSTSLLQYELDTSLSDLAARRGEAAAGRAFRLCADAVERIGELAAQSSIPCGFRREESVYGATLVRDVPPLRREYELRTRLGFDVDYWDRRRVAAESTLPFHAALVSRPAAQLDAHAFTHGLLVTAARRGARVYDRTAVLRYETAGRGVKLITNRGPEIRARRLVIASGYEAEDFLELRATRLQTTFALVSEPVTAFPGWPGRRLIWETARPYFYLRTTEDNRVLFGGADEWFTSPARRDRLLPAKVRFLLKHFHRYFPAMAIEPAYAWAGTFAVTRDGLPFIGSHPSFPRATFALGYGGNGITFSVVAAQLIRDLCLGIRNEDAELFQFGR